jgi:Ala-tRNA(Pro) deacylase
MTSSVKELWAVQKAGCSRSDFLRTGPLTFSGGHGFQNEKEAKPMADLYQILAEHHIEYQRHDHPAVYTVEDTKRLVPPLPAAKTKNLFLRDHKGRRHFLVIVPADKRVDIKALRGVIGSSRLSFGSADRLKKYLGVDPGSVTVFALINDPDHKVELIMDDCCGSKKRFSSIRWSTPLHWWCRVRALSVFWHSAVMM